MIKIESYQMAISNLKRELEKLREELKFLIYEIDREKSNLTEMRRWKTIVSTEARNKDNELFSLYQQIKVISETYKKNRNDFVKLTDNQIESENILWENILKLTKQLETIQSQIIENNNIEQQTLRLKEDITELYNKKVKLEIEIKNNKNKYDSEVNELREKQGKYNNKLSELKIKEDSLIKREISIQEATINLQALKKEEARLFFNSNTSGKN